MKKLLFTGILLASGIILIGCDKENNDTKKNTIQSTSTSDSTIVSTEISEKEIATFKDGVFTTDEFKISIKEKHIIKSPSEEKYGLYVVYDITNLSDSNIVPKDIMDSSIEMQQTTETSLVTLDNVYYYLDAFGDDDYNNQVEISNRAFDELLPQKTLEIVEGYSLENTNSPITMIAVINDTEIGTLEINLNDLEKPQEETVVSTSSTEQSYIDEAPVYDQQTEQSNNTESVVPQTNGLTQAEIEAGAGNNAESEVNAKWHEAMENGMSPVEAYNYANGTNLTEDEYYGYDTNNNFEEEVFTDESANEDALQERDAFVEEFQQQNGREPSSGEIQMHWLEENGLLEE